MSRLTSAVVMVMPADGPSLGMRTGGHVEVHRAAATASGRCRSSVGVRLHVGQRDLRRLLHHVTQLAGERQAASPSIAVASMNSTSPPTPVTARPVATPGTDVRSATSA